MAPRLPAQLGKNQYLIMALLPIDPEKGLEMLHNTAVLVATTGILRLTFSMKMAYHLLTQVTILTTKFLLFIICDHVTQTGVILTLEQPLKKTILEG